MKYMSIDIETSGFDPDKCQILEIGVVLDDLLHPEIPIYDLPTATFFVENPTVHWEREAFLLHRKAGACRSVGLNEQWATHSNGGSLDMIQTNLLALWRNEVGGDEEIIAAGKNFASFDLLFLRRYCPRLRFHHRSLDPTLLYTRLTDIVPPSTAVCLDRAGIQRIPSHRAVEDAKDIVYLIRRGLNPNGYIATQSVGTGQ